jgi:hypothetical protein
MEFVVLLISNFKDCNASAMMAGILTMATVYSNTVQAPSSLGAGSRCQRLRAVGFIVNLTRKIHDEGLRQGLLRINGAQNLLAANFTRSSLAVQTSPLEASALAAHQERLTKA